MTTQNTFAQPRRGRLPRQSCLTALLGIVLLCLFFSVASLWSNRSLPAAPLAPERLEPLDKIRLAETLHLKSSLGDAIWDGFGLEPIPIVLHYGQVSFLIGYPGRLPEAWQEVLGDDFQGQVYYRKPETNPQNFALQVGEVWVAGLATKTMADQFLIQTVRDFLPPVLDTIFPYRILIQPSETQIGGVIHESFHVIQARRSPERLEAAESIHRLGDRYWAMDAKMRTAWSEEANLLSKAGSATTDAEARQLAQQFLEARQQRRQQAGLSADLVDYERWLEWEEGLAKYTEVKILQLAFESGTYQPLSEMAMDPDFNEYRGYKNRWTQEAIQLKLQARQEGESRFYQTGLAIATLLDRLDEGWKDRVLEEGVFLEDLLQATVKTSP